MIATAGTSVNAQMVFDVTGINGTEVTLRVTSYEMDLKGNRSQYSSEIVINTADNDIDNAFSVGTVGFAAFDLEDAANLTVGDKFLLNIKPVTAVADDLVNITQTTDENGQSVSRNFTYYLNSFDNKTTTVDYVTLDDTNGDIGHSEIQLHLEPWLIIPIMEGLLSASTAVRELVNLLPRELSFATLKPFGIRAVTSLLTNPRSLL